MTEKKTWADVTLGDLEKAFSGRNLQLIRVSGGHYFVDFDGEETAVCRSLILAYACIGKKALQILKARN